MAVSINWATRVISVPKADMALIQTDPFEIRELDLDWFRLQLKSLEDNEAGIVFPDTHRHNAPVTVGGVTLAMVVEIINGYTVTFENGNYAVNLVGANSNVSDVTNLNYVSIRSANSAGLIVTEGGGGTDWTSAERRQIRDALGVDGDKVPASGGQLQDKAEPGDEMALTTDAETGVVDAVWDEQMADHQVTGSMGANQQHGVTKI